MLFLMNSNNDHTKKDLHLTYSQRNMNVYPSTIELMTRYLSTQYPNINSGNQRNSKKGDRSGKKRDHPKSENKDSNTASTVGAHIEDTTPAEEYTAPS